MKKLIIAVACILAFPAFSIEAKDWKEVRIAEDVPYQSFTYRAPMGR